MEVDVLRATEHPERLVCQTARGDYFEGYVGDTDYWDLMKDVEVKDRHRDKVQEIYDDDFPKSGSYWDAEAATCAFIEKQLSRGHYGPWEHPQITFAVKGVPVFTERQLIRHRHLSFDVQSMRYADFSDAPVTTPKSMTDASHFSRETGLTEIEEETMEYAKEIYEKETAEAFKRYEVLVEMGIPKEDARAILPLGTEVNLTVSGNARSFLHLLDMRRKANAQWSIRELSEMMLDELFEWMPMTFNYYEDHGPNKLSP